ncbi:MAG: GPW/gp25 family protein [Nannocystaceae bacterium]
MSTSFPYRIDRTGRTAVPTDERANVREMIEQVLFTTPGERPGRPDFGTGAYQLLFEPGGVELQAATQQLIRGALQQWLASHIEVQEVAVVSADSTLEITVRYVLRSNGQPHQDAFVVTRPA